jgi:hypothetical protein
MARACREKLELYGYTDDETFKFGTRNLKVDRELKVTSIVDYIYYMYCIRNWESLRN